MNTILLLLLVAIEARGEPVHCQEAVIDVAWQRVADDRFPDTLIGVLSQPGQFQWWDRRWDKMKKIDNWWPLLDMVANYKPRPTKALFFYNKRTAKHKPHKRGIELFTCGNHTFVGLK